VGVGQACVLPPLFFTATAESARVPRWKLQNRPFTFVDDLVLLASSEQGLQHALDRFSAACDKAGMKISTEKASMLCLSRNPTQFML